MSDKLVRIEISSYKNLSSDEYFKKLIEELAKNDILTERELENILLKRIIQEMKAAQYQKKKQRIF